MAGPLAGVRVLELTGVGPAPFGCMLLADLGADVIAVDRPEAANRPGSRQHRDVLRRGRRSIAVNLKESRGRDLVMELVANCDVLVEGFRPGVTERLGVGPVECLERNPALIYGRMTGWGQEGPLAHTAGHDLTYLAITGLLDGARRAGGRPAPPMNLLGDVGAGALYLALGIVAALFEARTSGVGQVVDASIVDGAASMSNMILGLRAMGRWNRAPGENLADTGAPFYDTHVCADGKEIAVAALEPQFYAELLRLTGMQDSATEPAIRVQPGSWEPARESWEALFATRPRDEWLSLFEGTDACVAPVLSLAEAPQHPHLQARGTYVTHAGVLQAAPAPRFDRTVAGIDRPPAAPGQHTDEILAELAYPESAIAALRADGTVA